MTNLFRRLVASVAAASLAISGVAFAAPAPLISAEQLAGQAATTSSERSADRVRLHAVLERADLAAALQERGVSAEDLRLRVDALTDAEASQLLAQIDEAPAGAASVVGVLVTIFVVLLVTDLLGLTSVFPFMRR
jgi:hypothetical protein